EGRRHETHAPFFILQMDEKTLMYCTGARKASEKVNMTFVEDDGTEIKVEAELGTTLLEVAHENDVELE
ncbi:unnamed protein product, partial [Scytosiphon promiscuus]